MLENLIKRQKEALIENDFQLAIELEEQINKELFDFCKELGIADPC
jgi:hypothetical protein